MLQNLIHLFPLYLLDPLFLLLLNQPLHLLFSFLLLPVSGASTLLAIISGDQMLVFVPVVW